MIVVVVLVAVVFIAAVAAAVFVAAQRAAVPSGGGVPAPRVVGPARPYVEPRITFRDPDGERVPGPVAQPTTRPTVGAAPLFDLAAEPVNGAPRAAAPNEAHPAEPSAAPVLQAVAETAEVSRHAVGAPANASLPQSDLAPTMEAGVRWSARFDPRSGPLDATARLRLIGDLGVVADEWCVPLLTAAYDEEQRPGHKQAALIALAACRSRSAIPAYHRALAGTDNAERSIAADALADLEPQQKTKPRTVVERR